MPRSIIDTASSRPGYIRRRAIQWAIVVFVLIAILVGIYFIFLNKVPAGHAAVAPLSLAFQETSPIGAESGAFPSRRSHAA